MSKSWQIIWQHGWRRNDVNANQSKGVIPLFHESGIASSLHDVSKKDLNLGLFTNRLRSMMALNKRSFA